MAGGLRSFFPGPFDTLTNTSNVLSQERSRSAALSSAFTLIRTETKEDTERTDFRIVHERLTSAVERAYASARDWIRIRRLDALLIFNGRMDATRALLEAAKDARIPIVTVDRTWFSDGLLLVPNDGPLELKQHHRLNLQFRDRPLTRRQASLVARRVASRFLRTNNTEWRAYNRNAVDAPWPAGTRGIKTLILPSSRNETEGHPDWKTGWPSFGYALDSTMNHLAIENTSTVLRSHPNWGERIGLRTGELSESYYSRWATSRGIRVVESRDPTSSVSLMAQADLIVVNGGSAVFEASALGKPCISLSPATYSEAGFCGQVFSADMLHNCEGALALHNRDIIKLGLRAGYTHNYRHSQFTKYVRAKTPTEFSYYEGATADRIIKLLKTGSLEPDDPEFAVDDSEESEICEMIEAKEWEKVASLVFEESEKSSLIIRRRPMLRWMDRVRQLFPRGDV
jgi:hypothetical protein